MIKVLNEDNVTDWLISPDFNCNEIFILEQHGLYTLCKSNIYLTDKRLMTALNVGEREIVRLVMNYDGKIDEFHGWIWFSTIEDITKFIDEKVNSVLVMSNIIK